MGWSVDIIKEELDAIFKPAGIKYTIDHPDAMTPRVYINYEREIPLESMRAIVKKFPDFVHVYFFITKIPEKPAEEANGSS